MKRLVAVRLVNWYHFTHETFRVRGSTLLLGDNGSGKSTVLDAIQLALVADMGQVRFNKAANEQSRRTIYGYVRHKLGTEDEARPGHVRFGRGACTSYIVLGFADDVAGEFVSGLVMDATEADTQVSRTHFVLPGMRVEDVPILQDGNIVRPEKEFRAVLRERKENRVFSDARSYRDEVRQRLGPLPDSFHRLIVKGLDFKLIGRVEDFVHNYLLDENPVDTASLQTNLENYKRLEGKAKEAEERVAELDGICADGEKIRHERKVADGHLFIALSAEIDIAKEAVENVAERTRANRLRADEIVVELGGVVPQIATASKERDRVVALLQQAAVFQQRESLKTDLSRARDELTRSKAADTEAREILSVQSAALDTLASDEACGLRARRPELLEEAEIVGRSDHPPIVTRLRETLRRDGALTGRDLVTWRGRLEKAKDTVSLARLRLKLVADELTKEGEELARERKELEAGKHVYPLGVEALLHLLRAKLKGKREPVPLCEVIDVRGDRWRNAVEGYLNTRRFDVLVAPEDFPRALSLYERNKHAYPLPKRGEVFIHGVGLVDSERIAAAGPRRERRSLAEHIVTDDPLARDYVDSVIGDVICCESEAELRDHRRSITDTVMVYQGHVARQTDPRIYQRHYIGQAARLRRLDEIDRRHGEIVAMFGVLDADMSFLARAATTCARAIESAARLPDLVEDAAQLAYRIEHVARLERQLEALDTSEIDALTAERETIEAFIADLEKKKDALNREAGACDSELERLAAEAVKAAADLANANGRFATELAHVEDNDRANWARRYEDERRTRTASDVRDAFLRQQKIRASIVVDLVRDLAVRKAAYSQKYGFFSGGGAEDFGDFVDERDAWKESRLPEYRTQIAKAKEEAIQQLAEDIIFRLRERLRFVEQQIRGLNHALRDVRFGNERYQFLTPVAPTHRPFYDLIQAAGAHEKDSLFGNAALRDAAAHETLQGLFNRLVEGRADEVRSELEQLADYRKFFDYDIKILHADGTHQLYNKVVGDKSGGETQTPFYIAIFASMYRLYRQLHPNQRPTCGLLLLDEAFSKMDGARIAATLGFAHALDLQLVVATPKERSELVAPHVTTSLYIHKDPMTGMPSVLDFTKELGRDVVSREGDAALEATGSA